MAPSATTSSTSSILSMALHLKEGDLVNMAFIFAIEMKKPQDHRPWDLVYMSQKHSSMLN